MTAVRSSEPLVGDFGDGWTGRRLRSADKRLQETTGTMIECHRVFQDGANSTGQESEASRTSNGARNPEWMEHEWLKEGGATCCCPSGIYHS